MIILIAAAVAADVSNWRCSYDGIGGADTPVPIDFRRRGAELVDSWGHVYSIVAENGGGIVAARGEANPAGAGHPADVEGSLIVINKETGAFTRTSLAAPAHAGAENVGRGWGAENVVGRCTSF